MPEVEKSVLAQVFGETSFIKVLDVLLDHPNLDYSKKELAEAADISEPTLYKVWPKIEELDLVEPTRKYGKTQLYKLNTESELAEEIMEFESKVRENKSILGSPVEA